MAAPRKTREKNYAASEKRWLRRPRPKPPPRPSIIEAKKNPRQKSRVWNPPIEEGGGDKRNKQRYELWSSIKFTSIGFILITPQPKCKG